MTLRTLASAIGILGASMYLFGCANQAQPTASEVRQWVAERYVAPFRDGDVNTWLQVFSDDALAMHNTLPPLRGHEAIRGFGEMVHTNLDIQRFDVRVLEVTDKGSFILTDGSFVSRMVPKGSAPDGPDATGKFVLLWQRQPDGQWRVVLDMGNQSTRCGFEQCD